MNNWYKYLSDKFVKGEGAKALQNAPASELMANGIYPDSINDCGEGIFFIVKEETDKKLVISGSCECAAKFSGEEKQIGEAAVKVCSLTHENAAALREVFPFTAPSSVLKNNKTIGLGDRLGVATPGHIRLIKNYDIKPIFAQQSIRELNLTGRTYAGVLDDVTWAVFQEGYKGGFGADGDHLKLQSEVEMALNEGFTMLTLDCSEHINKSIPNLTDAEVDKLYAAIPPEKTASIEQKYMNKAFDIGNGNTITFGANELKRTVLIYLKAVEFAAGIYFKNVANNHRGIDFEMSIDETLTSTSPQAHFFVAKELIDAGVKAVTIAPRFCGEFQKGIDYIGDIAQFEQEFKLHAAIAKHFGYKLSIHSGSDKFSVFGIIGRETHGKYHVKTAGTNWLEAVRLVTIKAPGLYREMHKFALEALSEAKKYYHIKADVGNIPDIDKMKDSELPELMNLDDSRQVLHITYGLILNAKNADGSLRFRGKLYNLLFQNEEEFYELLQKHIGRHLKELGN